VNLCSRKSPYSLNCHVGAMLVFRMLCRITQSSDAHRTESVSVIDHEQTMGVSSRVLDQKQQNISGRISLFWSVELQGYDTPSSWTEVTTIGWFRHRWTQFVSHDISRRRQNRINGTTAPGGVLNEPPTPSPRRTAAISPSIFWRPFFVVTLHQVHLSSALYLCELLV